MFSRDVLVWPSVLEFVNSNQPLHVPTSSTNFLLSRRRFDCNFQYHSGQLFDFQSPKPQQFKRIAVRRIYDHCVVPTHSCINSSRRWQCPACDTHSTANHSPPPTEFTTKFCQTGDLGSSMSRWEHFGDEDKSETGRPVGVDVKVVCLFVFDCSVRGDESFESELCPSRSQRICDT